MLLCFFVLRGCITSCIWKKGRLIGVTLLSGNTNLWTRRRQHRSAAKGTINWQQRGGQGRPSTTQASRTAPCARTGQYIAILLHSVGAGNHAAALAHSYGIRRSDNGITQLYTDALSRAQRAGISQQSGSVNLQPGLGILPTLFGMQQAPGISMPVNAASAHADFPLAKR